LGNISLNKEEIEKLKEIANYLKRTYHGSIEPKENGVEMAAGTYMFDRSKFYMPERLEHIDFSVMKFSLSDKYLNITTQYIKSNQEKKDKAELKAKLEKDIEKIIGSKITVRIKVS